jgi:hypothetical protein
MAAAPAMMMVLVSLREDIVLSSFVDALDLRVAAGAGAAVAAIWEVAERLAGMGCGLALRLC